MIASGQILGTLYPFYHSKQTLALNGTLHEILTARPCVVWSNENIEDVVEDFILLEVAALEGVNTVDIHVVRVREEAGHTPCSPPGA